jgi:hypothetical protein
MKLNLINSSKLIGKAGKPLCSHKLILMPNSLSMRHFSAGNPIRGAVNELIDKNMFDPDFQDNYYKFNKKMMSVKKIERKEEDELLHGEDAGMIFKYDLPVVNLPIKYKNEMVLLEGEDADPTNV